MSSMFFTFMNNTNKTKKTNNDKNSTFLLNIKYYLLQNKNTKSN